MRDFDLCIAWQKDNKGKALAWFFEQIQALPQEAFLGGIKVNTTFYAVYSSFTLIPDHTHFILDKTSSKITSLIALT